MAFFNDNTILIMLFSSLVLKNTSERKFPTDMSKEKKTGAKLKFVAHIPCSKHLAIIAVSSGPLSCLHMLPVDSFGAWKLTTPLPVANLLVLVMMPFQLPFVCSNLFSKSDQMSFPVSRQFISISTFLASKFPSWNK